LKRRRILMLFSALVVLALLLLYAVLLQSAEAPLGLELSVATDVGFLITVVLCISIGFWLTFEGERAKNWKKAGRLVVGLICGSVVLWFLGVGETIETGFPAPLNSLSIAADFLFATAVIMGLAAIVAFILILDKHFAEADIKAEAERHRLPENSLSNFIGEVQ
jgi:hypothetical protein